MRNSGLRAEQQRRIELEILEAQAVSESAAPSLTDLST
jgi:hypothetical protein